MKNAIRWTSLGLVLTAGIFVGCERKKAVTEGAAAPASASDASAGVAGELCQTGDAVVKMKYNITPNAAWEPTVTSVRVYADARRNPNIGEEDIFASIQYPGQYPRQKNQHFELTVPNVTGGETILVQGYICSDGSGDCYPSDHDNPPSCAVAVKIKNNLKPACKPEFTWTGGSGNGGVICRAECN
jgi:hypothetical protein